jgi:hypothetical protein
VDEGFQHGHQGVLVIPQTRHHKLARGPEISFDSRNLHGVDTHTGEPEGNPLGGPLTGHGNLKTISEIDVDHVASMTFNHDVVGVAVAQPEDVTLEEELSFGLRGRLGREEGEGWKEKGERRKEKGERR